MQPECSVLHPGAPSVVLSRSDAVHACLACAQARVCNNKLIATVRSAAAHQLYALCNAPDELLRHGTHLAENMLHKLLSAYFNLHLGTYETLAQDTRMIICSLAVCFDCALAAEHPVYPHLRKILSVCVQQVSEEAPREQRRLAVECMSAALSTARSSQTLRDGPLLETLRTAVEEAGSCLVIDVFTLLPCDDKAYQAVACVLSPLLAVLHPKTIDVPDVVARLSSALPLEGTVAADVLALSVAHGLMTRNIQTAFGSTEPAWDVQKVSSEVVESVALTNVLKRSVLSEESRLRDLATSVVSRVCEASHQAASALCNCGLFEYVVESIRTLNMHEEELPTEKKMLVCSAIKSAAAIVQREPADLSDKWCYSLDVFLSTCQYLPHGESIPLLFRILSHAFRNAPLPVFSHELIEKFVGFQLKVSTLLRQVNCKNSRGQPLEDHEDKDAVVWGAILDESLALLSDFLTKYRPCSSTIESLLRGCEASLQSGKPPLNAFRLITRIFERFLESIKKSESREAVASKRTQDLAHMLLFLTFNPCARAVEDIVGDAEARLRDDYFNRFLCSAVSLFGSALDPAFAELGFCSDEGQNAMRTWCWQYLPPREVFAISRTGERVPLEATGESWSSQDTSAGLQKYLHRMSSTTNGIAEDHGRVDLVPTTEVSFLNSLSTIADRSAVSLQLLEASIELDMMTSLCSPEGIAEALATRFRRTTGVADANDACLDLAVARDLSFTCCRYGFQFEMLELRHNVFASVVGHESFCMRHSQDFDVFQQTVTRPVRSAADVHAWDKLVQFMGATDTESHQEETLLWNLILENDSVVTSAIFAISNSSAPHEIVECLISLAEDRHRSSELIKAFERSEVVDALAKGLGAIRSSSVERLDKDVRKLNDELERRRLSSFLLLLSREGSSALHNIRLFCLTCDIFVREASLTSISSGGWLFMTHLLRLLIVSIDHCTDDTLISYVQRSSLIVQAVRLMRTSQGQDMFRDQFVSSAACLLVAIVQCCSLVGSENCPGQLLEDLAGDQSLWQHLLSSFSAITERDWAYKVSNCCCLLECLLSFNRTEGAASQTACSIEITTILAVAASSERSFLHESALRVLLKGMSGENLAPHVSSTQLQYSINLLSKISSLEASPLELLYVEAAVLIGHVDAFLGTLKLATRTCVEKQGQNLSSEQRRDHGDELPVTVTKLQAAIKKREEEIASSAAIERSARVSRPRIVNESADNGTVGTEKSPRLVVGRSFIVYTFTSN